MSATKHRSRSVFSIALLIVVLGGLFAVLNRQYISDYIDSANFQPSEEIIALRDTLALTDKGTFYFNASRPQIDTSQTFNQACKKQEANSPILGCYTENRIYVYDVTKRELSGIKETTAAHELLHAVYQRLGISDKKQIDALLKATYEKIKTPELEARMAYYEKSEPGQELNELHSILGTEQPNIDDGLEKHYAKYFSSRAKIVAFYDQYSSVFTTAINRITSLQDAINTAVESINQRITNYNQATVRLEAEITSFNERNSNNSFSSQASFDNERAILLARQTMLNSERSSINSAIEQVKITRSEYDTLVATYNQLSQSIDSSVNATPSIQQ